MNETLKDPTRLAPPREAYRWRALAATIIGNFMSTLDTSIVNIALPKMMAIFSVASQDAQWILTAYMLTMGVTQPVSGYLADRFGTRRVYLFSLTVFTIGSALCGIAWSNSSMIFFRIIQAVGGGLIYPVTMTIIYHNFSREERYRAMSIWGVSAMVAPAVGPALSGYLVQYWDWRLIFTINVPIGIMGCLLAALILKETVVHRDGKFDTGGFITASLGLFCLLLALNKGAEAGWTSACIIALLYISFASLALFVVIEHNHANPLLNLTIFKSWNFTCSSMVLFIGTAGLYGGLFMVPLFMESIRGYTAMQTGILMLPAALTTGLMMPIAVRLARKFGPKPVVVSGIIILGGASLPFARLDMDTAYDTVLLVMVIRGAGLGLFLMTATTLGMNALPLTQISRATSMKSVIRQLAGSFGIALLSTVIQHRQVYHMAHTAVQRQAFILAFDDAFIVLAMLCFVGVVPALCLRTKPRSGKLPAKEY